MIDLCVLNAVVYSTYANNSVIDATTSPTHNVSITCYAKHICLYHKVDITWLINFNSIQDKPVKYSTSDSDKLYKDHGVLISTRCPEYECYSTLTLPRDGKLNNTSIVCGAFTEVCPGEVKYSPNSVVIVTKRKAEPPSVLELSMPRPSLPTSAASTPTQSPVPAASNGG